MSKLVQNFLIIILIFIIISGLFALFSPETEQVPEVPFSQLAFEVAQEKVKEITVQGEDVYITYKAGTEGISFKEPGSSIVESFSIYGVTQDQLKKIIIKIEKEKGGTLDWLVPLLSILFPLLIFGWFFWIIFRQAKQGPGGQSFSFLKPPTKVITGKTKDKTTFKDIADLEEAKQEVKEVVDFLKSPRKYWKMGARIPRGVLLVGAPGTGKCITGNTYITTNKGMLKIRDIPKYFRVDEKGKVYGCEIFTVNLKDLNPINQSPSHWFDLGEQKTIRVVPQFGMELEGTPEHPVIVLNKKNGDFAFKRLDKVQKDDILVLNYNHQSFGNYNILPNEETAYLLGLLVGDGCFSVRNNICFSNKDKDTVAFVKRYFKEYFGIKMRKIPYKKYDWYISDWKIKDKFKEYGIHEDRARRKTIPESILLGPKRYQTSFLRGLFDTDGSCSPEKSYIELASASKELINQVQVLLLNLGIINRVRKKKSNQYGSYHHYLEISGDFIEKFATEIGFEIKEKQEKLNNLLAKTRNTNVNLVLYQQKRFSSLFSYVKSKSKNTNRAFYNLSPIKQLYRYLREERNPSKETVSKILRLFAKTCPSVKRLSEYKYLYELSNNRFFFSPIKKIEKGQEKVYDFTVPKYHSFVANGLINHNTMLARAVANEAKVPFFSMAGSEFIELFVGVGASRTRNLFETAKKSQPSIIFIDELDAIGKARMPGIGGGHEEREQTLNQILSEMDGFERETGVIVMAATNKPESLDPALLRPGRFDRRIVLDLPDVKGREGILKIHCHQKPLSSDVSLTEIAERTPGFSGADLANLVNEAAILAARREKKHIFQEEFLESIEKVLLGPERKSHLLSKKEKELSAYHEAGHALVSYSLPEAEEVRKVSIVSRGVAAGYTLSLPKREKRIHTQSEFKAELAVLMGGRSAERIVFNELSTGASNDLQRASNLARDLVTKYGMSKLGPISFGKRHASPFLGWEEVEKNYSDKIASKIDKETERFILEAENKALSILKKKRKTLERIAKALIEKETIEKEEFEKLARK